MTAGTVISVDRGNHLSITARYFVDHRQIEQTFGGSYKDIGDLVEIYYLPSDPSVAGIQNPKDWLENTVRVLLMGTMVVGALVVFTIHFPAVGRALRPPGWRFQFRPRFAITWIAIAVAIGTVARLFSSVTTRLLFADAFAIAGMALLCKRTFQLPHETSWSMFARSRTALLAVALVIAAQLINSWGAN